MPCPRSRGCPNSSWSWSWSTPQVQYYSTCPNQQGQGGSGGGSSGGGTNFTPAKGHPPTGPKEFSGNYYEYGLYLHNWYRRRHGAGELRLVDRLNRDGDSYCATLAPRRTLVHSTGRDYGENLFMTTDTSISDKEAVRQACKGWYDEIKDYSYSNPGFSMATGHFTAMVWKSSTELGIGVARGNGCVVVAGCYKVHPNMMNSFGPNVLPWRDVPETDDESSDEEEEEVKPEAKPKKVEKVSKGKKAEAAEDEKLSETIRDSFKQISDKDGTIGQTELKDWLNKNVKVTFKFDSFDELITKLLISTATIEDGEKTRVGLDEFSKILITVQGMLDAYSEFDSDGSGTLDPFELKDALKEAGFCVSYKLFLTLFKFLASEDGSNLDPKKMMLNFREYVLAYLLLTKLQVVQRKRAEKKSGGFEDFSLAEWLEEQVV